MPRRTQADTEFLAREIASIRLALADVVTTADLHESLDAIRHAIENIGTTPPPGLAPDAPRLTCSRPMGRRR